MHPNLGAGRGGGHASRSITQSTDSPTGFHKTVTFQNCGGYCSGMIKPITLSLSLCIGLPTVAQAQMTDLSCDDSARMTDRLTKVVGAERQGTGLRDPDTLLEIWVARGSGDWMIVQNYANGTSCIIAMGEHWEAAQGGPA